LVGNKKSEVRNQISALGVGGEGWLLISGMGRQLAKLDGCDAMFLANSAVYQGSCWIGRGFTGSLLSLQFDEATFCPGKRNVAATFARF
jgi:hypothetical protein